MDKNFGERTLFNQIQSPCSKYSCAVIAKRCFIEDCIYSQNLDCRNYSYTITKNFLNLWGQFRSVLTYSLQIHCTTQTRKFTPMGLQEMLLLVKSKELTLFCIALYYLSLTYSPTPPHTSPLPHYMLATVVCFSPFFFFPNKLRMIPSSESLHSTSAFHTFYHVWIFLSVHQLICHHIKEIFHEQLWIK